LDRPANAIHTRRYFRARGPLVAEFAVVFEIKTYLDPLVFAGRGQRGIGSRIFDSIPSYIIEYLASRGLVQFYISRRSASLDRKINYRRSSLDILQIIPLRDAGIPFCSHPA